MTNVPPLYLLTATSALSAYIRVQDGDFRIRKSQTTGDWRRDGTALAVAARTVLR
jgi:hypothetical protein